jgi:hypothetical protein
MHCLVFLKSGIFKLFFENAKEYDKLRDYISSPISWDKKELTALLAVRIRQIRGKSDIDETTAWGLEFDAASGLDKIQDYIVSRCVSGPRDLIVYCNMAKDLAKSAKITLKECGRRGRYVFKRKARHPQQRFWANISKNS